MASRPEMRTIIQVAIATALAAVAWWLGGQFHPYWWAAWLMPLPLLWLAPRVRAPWAALAALVAIVIGDLPRWTFARDLLEVPLYPALFSVVAPGLVVALAVLLYRRLYRHGRYLAAAFAVPAVSTAIYFLNAMGSIDGTGGDPGYTQMDALPVIQVAALTGLWGIGFVVMLGAATLALALDRAVPRAARLRTVAVAGGLVALALAYGGWRLHAAPADRGQMAKIGLVSLKGPLRPQATSTEGRALLQRYDTAIGALAEKGAQFVLIPETTWAVPGTAMPALGELARRHDVTLLAGVASHAADGVQYNRSLVFRPDAVAPTAYTKHHLVPGWEKRYTPGTTFSMLDGSPRIGLAICKDMDFPAMGRAYAARDAQLLLVPAWDFDTDDWLHGRQAVLRGVESGFAVARAARDGRLTLSDDRGRILADTSTVHRDATLVGSLPLRGTHTLYARWGDWFGWVAVALLALLTGWSLRRSQAPAEDARASNPSRSST